MPDITKCLGEGCQKKYSCFRYSANANIYQSYFIKTPIIDDKCEYYINHNMLPKWEKNIQTDNCKY